MAERLARDLWRLEIPLEGSPLKTLNSYFIRGERSLLIDTGFRWDSCRAACERQLAELGADRDRMDIFVTHLHSDHSGLAPELIRPGCQILIGETDGAGVADYMEAGCWRSLYARYVRDGFSKEETDRLQSSNPAQTAAPAVWGRYRPLRDGDTLSYGGHTLRCILTPGHTPGHMCLYEPESKWLFTGDHILFHISPNICRWEAMPDALGSYLESLRTVRDLPVDLLLPAHRRETGVLRDRADELTAHHLRRIEDAWETVRQEPGLTGYEIAGRMHWRIRSRGWEDFPLEQKFFAVGEALAHLDYLEVRGWVRRREERGKYRYYATE
nr:MBL fold metallo-hydrolase [uncultured Oscillibacter sp.]